MWLFILVIALIVLGLTVGIAGLGIYAVAPIVIGLVVLTGALLNGRRAPGGPASTSDDSPRGALGTRETPQDTEHAPRPHVSTGHAHPGQKRMVP